MQERRIKLEQMLKTPGFANDKTSSEIFTACYFIESNKKICGQMPKNGIELFIRYEKSTQIAVWMQIFKK